MKKEQLIQTIRRVLSLKLGHKLTGKMGKNRLLDIAKEIADYKEQMGWGNSPQEIRRLTEKIRYIPAQVGLTLQSLHLSKKSEIQIHAALWQTLKRTIPSLVLQPN